MSDQRLPTPDQMLARAQWWLDRAYQALSDAGDELRSDWRPVGSSLTDQQAAKRAAMRKAIDTAKNAINEAKSV